MLLGVARAFAVVRGIITESRGLPGLQAAYATAIEVCGASGELERAFGLLEQYEAEQLPPSRRIYHQLIRACRCRTTRNFLL